MLSIFRREKKPVRDYSLTILELQHLSSLVRLLKVPVVADDTDAGHDDGIDEVLNLIRGRINHYVKLNDTEMT